MCSCLKCHNIIDKTLQKNYRCNPFLDISVLFLISKEQNKSYHFVICKEMGRLGIYLVFSRSYAIPFFLKVMHDAFYFIGVSLKLSLSVISSQTNT